MTTWQEQPLKSVVQITPSGSVQNSPLQHPLDEVQAWPILRQVEPGWQVPVVEPGLSTQLKGGLEQQSALELHVAPCGWQAGGGPQWPVVQYPEQQVAGVEHPASLPLHVVPPSVGTWQTVPISEDGRQSVPAQHSLLPAVQAEPNGLQVAATHWRPPSAPTVQGSPLQHWSLKSQ
jgi:hypothetical protein